MKWRGRRESANVRDARGDRVGGFGGGRRNLSSNLLSFIGQRFGFKGIIIAVVLFLLGWKLGLINPQHFLGDGAVSRSSGPVQVSPEEQERFQFVKVVLADNEDVWTREFQRLGKNYVLPKMVIYRGRVNTGCGMGSAQMGPFYCPADQTIYIDLGFYDELAKTFRSPGDFAQAYVVAHEVGHHIQKLLGISDQVSAMRGRPDYNQYSVRLELQADYLAGVWTHHSQKYLEQGDIEEAMRAANAIGDDAIQSKTQGRVVPHAFTHGTSEQRMRWFNKGLQSGKIEGGDTFSMPYEQL